MPTPTPATSTPTRFAPSSPTSSGRSSRSHRCTRPCATKGFHLRCELARAARGGHQGATSGDHPLGRARRLPARCRGGGGDRGGERQGRVHARAGGRSRRRARHRGAARLARPDQLRDARAQPPRSPSTSSRPWTTPGPRSWLPDVAVAHLPLVQPRTGAGPPPGSASASRSGCRGRSCRTWPGSAGCTTPRAS